jgi:ABC-type transport system substrate-binding protein
MRQEAYKTLDPVKQFDASSAELIQNVYDSLLEYDYLTRPYRMVPNLLAKMPELSADGLTYSFELRSDVRFVDDPCFPGGKGRPLVTDDVIYSLKRFAHGTLNVKSYTLWQGAVQGMDEFREQTQKGADMNKLDIAGIKKIDDRKFTITLTKANPLALFPLAATQTSIVPREAVEKYGDQFEQHPVGTGPFKIKTLQRRGVTILEKNPNYHGVYPSEGEPASRTTRASTCAPSTSASTRSTRPRCSPRSTGASTSRIRSSARTRPCAKPSPTRSTSPPCSRSSRAAAASRSRPSCRRTSRAASAT